MTAVGGPPLAGMRVVEMTTAWAGPMAGRILAYLGAETIHVEAATLLDNWRGHKQAPDPHKFPDGIPGERPYNRTILFNSQNGNKLSLTLDLKKPGGIELMRELLMTADIFLSNFTPGTLERLGLGYADLSALKPEIIVAEMPAYGRSGRMAKSPAVGPTMEMASGMAGMIGYPGGPPQNTGPAYLDPMGGFNGAAAILTAVYHRQRTGRGQHVEIPQVEAAMQFIGDHILHAIWSGVDPARRGNDVDWAAPHDAFPALGEDEWVAIAVATDAEFFSMCRVIGCPELIDDLRFATLEKRLANRRALDVPITSWTSRQSKHEAAAALQAAGVAAAPVQKGRDVAGSEYLAARGFFTELDHPEAGRHKYQGLPFHLSLTPGGQRSAAPSLGQHTHAILRDVLGRDEGEIARLEAAGTTATKPPD